MRYVNRPGGTWLHHSPGGSGFAPLREGQGLRVVRDREGNIVKQGDFVEVQVINPDGSPQQGHGWVSGGSIKPKPSVIGFLFGDMRVGRAGRAMLNRDCSFEYNMCAASSQQVDPRLPGGIGVAKNYANPAHRNALVHHGFRELAQGERPQPDDVVVYVNRRAGHVGHVGFTGNGDAVLISNYMGRLRVMGLDEVNGQMHIYRYVGR